MEEHREASSSFFFRRRVPEGAGRHIRTETFRDVSEISEVTLSLSETALSYALKNLKTGLSGAIRSVPASTFLNAHVVENRLVISYYPMIVAKGIRRRCVLEIGMTSADHAASWCLSVRSVLFGDDVGAVPRRHILVLVNPFGGTKQAPKLWKTVVKPLWDEAGVTYDVIETEYAGHAKLLAREINLAHYDALTTISGDGLFWELLNGLFTRPDWSEAVKIPFCVMPGGSGNALASAAGIQDLETAAFSIARGRAVPMDIATVRQNQFRCVSFVLVAWGIVADVDFESERFRWMGSARFTVSAVQRIASLKLYRGRVSYYPDTTWKKGTCDRARCLPARDPGRPDASAPPLPRKDRSSVSGGAFAGLEVDSMPPGPPTPLLDALLAGNDAGWVHMDTDKLVMLTAANITHISADSKIAPFAQFSDGCWDLVIMNDVSKGSLLKMFLAMEKGEHVNSPDLIYIKAKAFRIIPDESQQQTSFLDVDGERMPKYGETMSEMHRGLLNFILHE